MTLKNTCKTPVNEDVDPLERAFKENKDVEFGKEEDFGDEAVASATSIISSVSPIQQNLYLDIRL